MKPSEVIGRLQALIAEHGELPLVAHDGDPGEPAYSILSVDLDSGEFVLNLIQLDDLCRTDGCDERTDDGEGYAGFCGNCADKLQQLEDAGQEINWDEDHWSLEDLDRAVEALPKQ